MIALGWNCRGLGNPRSVRVLRELVQRWKPGIVFLSETKMKNYQMNKVKFKIGLLNGLIVPSTGRSGGLAMLWNRDIHLEVQSYSRYFIDAVVTEVESGFKWRITGFYGNPETWRRKESWDFLRSLNRMYHLPWLCFGDFNEVVSVEEKLGGAPRSQKQMDDFREVIHQCGFKDLGFEGPEFTWCNMQEGDSRVLLRLDRALATPEWIDHYKNVKVHHLVESTSDHCALLLTDTAVTQELSSKRRFHFEAMWTKRAECKDIIQGAWVDSQDLHSPSGIAARLRNCAKNLSKWNKTVFGQIPKKIKEKRETLNYLVSRDKDGSLGGDINKLRKEINELLDSEEIKWQQRSKVQWLGLGDRNTKYFHSKASDRRRKNTINCIMDDGGVWHDSPDSIAEVAVSYFKNLYSTAYPTRIPEVLDSIPTKVSEEMNQALIKEFTREEIEVALNQMHPTKAPGPDDGFSSLIHDAARNYKISGISICKGCPKITHLFFADDSLLFCKANSQECQSLVNILQLYEDASGQKINADKSSIFFSSNTSDERRREVLNLLGPMQDTHHKKYLGLPSIIGKSKVEIFAEIKERVEKKLSGWKEKMLSIGGREILIKAVAQAIPTYAMSCFQIPKSLCVEMEAMMRKFWWGQRGQESRIAWVSWRRMCKSKLVGGMGFRNLQAFNLAMLAKQGWRLISNPNSLVAKIYRARYYPHGDVFHSKLGSSPSFTWRSIYNGLEVVKRGTRWHVGNGERILIWEDKWLPTPTTFKVVSPPKSFDDYPRVSALIDKETKRWKGEIVRSLFLPFEARTILNIPLCHSLPDDQIIWVGNKIGEFSVKSAYYIACDVLNSSDEGECSNGDSRTALWRKLWHLSIPPKVRIFAWRLCLNALPTLVNLQSKGVVKCDICPTCGKEPETISHVFVKCEMAKRVWRCWLDCPLVVLNGNMDIVDIALEILGSGSSNELEFFFGAAWAIWSNRNRILYESSSQIPDYIWSFAKKFILESRSALSASPQDLSRQVDIGHAAPLGFFKIKVDGATSESGKNSSVGVVIIDAAGDFVAACCKYFQGRYSVEEVEGLAMECGLLLAKELMLTQIILESDSMAAVSGVLDGNFGGCVGHIYQGICTVLASFSSWKVNHVRRDYNKAAHSLAQFARLQETSQVKFQQFLYLEIQGEFGSAF
ncbi:uncharacterized protein LOC115950456 [Quercus lobata]|uniref:uncharacterized protein LOC115950456 n=1 Tax=Quercus lobata TaxID=97700 RepID=UPI00124402CF|nr:uncharacterized protein LOC115950456 [Quercus lobata]